MPYSVVSHAEFQGVEQRVARLERHLANIVAYVERRLHQIEERISHMATQEDINAVVTQLQANETGIAAVDQKVTDAAAKLQAEIDALAAANPTLDLSALQAIPAELQTATSALGDHVDAVGNLTPTPPAAP